MKYTKDVLQEAVANSESIFGVLRYLGLRPAGGTHSHLTRRIKGFGIDISHFKGHSHASGKVASNRKHAKDVLVLTDESSCRTRTSLLRRSLLEIGRKYECDICSNKASWNNKSLVLQIDHINGKSYDNRPDNLRFLCPNCHSQTSTYGSKRLKHKL